VKDISSTSFGYLIAFLLPGIFGLYALSFWSPQIEVLLRPIRKADTSVGPSFVFLLIAVGIGVCLSGMRFFFLEDGLYKKLYKSRCIPPEIYEGMTADQLALHKAIMEEHYRYHQFYGNCAVALVILFIGWLWHSHPNRWQISYGSAEFVGFFLLLERSANDCSKEYVQKCLCSAARFW
jgi:hypothetical protein